MFRFSTRPCPVLAAGIAVLIAMPVSAAIVRPLSEAASSQVKILRKGSIVTAERKGDKVSYDVSGVLEPAGQSPEHAIFEIGSITKVFTGILLAQAVLEKKVSLTSTLRELMGKEQTFADARVGAITLEQLATHTSGLPRIPDDLIVGGDQSDPYAHYDRARLDAYLSKVTLKGDPPFESSYSNLGVGLLGDLLSRVYGRSWESLITEKITQPLGMKDTVATLDAEQEKRLAPPYNGLKKVKSWHDQALAGCGVLRSTAADMMRFGEAILHPDKSPLKDAFALVMQPHTANGALGLCLVISKFNGEREYSHNGGTGGYRTALQVLPDSGVVRVVLINNAAVDSGAVMGALIDQKPRKEDSGKVLTAAQMADYEGVYPVEGKASFTIQRHGDALWTRLTGQRFLRLYPHEQEDRFFLKDVAAELQFKREGGKVVSLINHQNGHEFTAKKSDAPPPAILFHTTKELAPYAGSYELQPKMIFTVQPSEGVLFVRLTGQDWAPALEKRADWFESDLVEAAFEFEREKDGKIVALILHQNGLVLRSPRKAAPGKS